MRNLDELDRQIMDILRKDHSSSLSLKVFFGVKEIALFLSRTHGKVFLLYKDEYTRKRGFSLIVQIVSLIEMMEKEGFLYCIPNTNGQDLFINADADANVGVGENDNIITISNGILEITDDEILQKSNNGLQILKGESLPQNLVDRILQYFDCTVFPSKSLEELSENNYEPLEIRSYKQEIRDAKIGRNIAFFALFVSLGSSFGMTFFNNKYAKTQICEKQYDKIIEVISNIRHEIGAKSKTDSVNNFEVIRKNVK